MLTNKKKYCKIFPTKQNTKNIKKKEEKKYNSTRMVTN
jgi:hypothetical protein